jgi:hypothetical protein
VNLAVLEGRNHTWERLGTLLTWVLIPLAIAGVVILVRARRIVWPLLAPIVTVSIVSVLTYGNQRFRIGADPMLAVLAAVSIVTVVNGIGTSSAGAPTPST